MYGVILVTMAITAALADSTSIKRVSSIASR